MNSSDQEGTSGFAVSEASISADGRFVAFASTAPNMVQNDTNDVSDVFVRDLQTSTTERVSLTDAGVELVVASGDMGIGISGDGRYVAFSSNAVNIVSGDVNATTDIFVRDRQNGTTRRVASDAFGRQPNSASYDPELSSDGSRVGFYS